MNPKDYPVWEWEKHGKILQGIYMGAFHNVGKWHHTLFVIKQDGKNGKPGKSWKVWETKQIKRALELSPVGTRIRLEYRGLVESEKNKGHKVKDYKINISRTGGEIDVRPRAQRSGAARRPTERQRQAQPLGAVGRSRPGVAAARTKSEKKIKIHVIKKREVAPAPPPSPAPVILAPPPIPPPGYGSQSEFLEGWKKRLKKL